MHALTRAALLVLALAAAPSASAAPCAGFADVDTSSPFCPNVEWLKNRGITLGCGASLYCPNEAVSRLAMAAFMNRLGTALTPVQLRVDASPGAIDLDVATFQCATDALAVNGFPRRAIVDGLLNATAAGVAEFSADPVFSVDGGATWTSLHNGNNFVSIEANRWLDVSQLGSVDLDVGQSVRFAIRLFRAGLPGTADLSASRCSLRVLVFSRDGSGSPL